MAWGINQIELIGLAILGLIFEPNGLGLDGDAALALYIHIIEHLLGHFTGTQSAADLDQPVGNCRFAMIDMGNDREVPDALLRRIMVFLATQWRRLA